MFLDTRDRVLDNDNSLRKRTNYIPGDTAIRVTLETKF